MDLENLIKTSVEREKQKNSKGTTIWNVMSDFGPIIAIVNFPVAVSVSLLGFVVTAIEEKSALKEIKMPDSLLKELSKQENISKTGLAFLANKIGDKGFVSAADAIEFLEIEQKEKQKATELELKKIMKEKAEEDEGALSIINRAKDECGNLLLFETKAVMDGLKNKTITGLKFGVDSISSLIKR